MEYGGISSSSVSVAVTQSINNVYADVISSSTFTFADNTWGYSEGTGEWSGSANGNQFTNNGVQVLNAAGVVTVTGTTSYSDVTSIVVTYNTNASKGDATLGMKVGTNEAKSNEIGYTTGDGRTAFYTSTFNYPTKQSGVVQFSVETGTNSVYICSITINTSSGSTNIANNASHKAAQKAAVAFAQAFNAAMDETENCTTGLDTAWTTCTNAYDSFKTAAAALGETEEAWALKLVKYATKQYSDDSAEACLERMMKTYEICVQKHGKTAFMSDLVTLGAPQVSPLVNIIGENSNTVAIIVIISMVSVTAIGGYFFIRKRKEQ